MRFATTNFKSLAFVVALVLACSSCASTTSTTRTPDRSDVPVFDVAPISWSDCTGDDAPSEPFQCGVLDVPLNYNDPNEEMITLSLIRLPSTGNRQGVVLTNPGGPGGSGFDFVAYSGESLSQSLKLDRYDLVGFDPRGVDRSSGIRCLSDELVDKYLYVDSTPDTPEEQALYDESRDLFTSECEKTYGRKIDHFSTVNTAHDMDAIRRAIGVSKIHYVGISYGTYLGGVYATLYPNQFVSMFLDAPFDPQGDTLEESYLTQMIGFEDAFNSWAAWCESETSCAFTAQDVGQRWDALLTQLDSEPLETSNGRLVNNTVMEYATIQSLYARSFWSFFATALLQAEEGIGEPLLRIADQYQGRNADGSFSTIKQSGRVIRCASGFGKDEPDDVDDLIQKIQQAAPRFGKDITAEDFDGNTCDGLTEGAPLFEIAYTGDAPIVVVGGEKDPATPIRWAEEMVGNLGKNARLVRFTGEGHSQVMTSNCVDNIGAALFAVPSTLPAPNTTCDPDPVLEKPMWWDELPAATGNELVLDADVLGSMFGFDPSEIFAEFRATTLSPAQAYRDYVTRFQSSGFAPFDPDATQAVTSAQFFGRDDLTVAFLIVDDDGIAEGQLSEPFGPVPPGQRLVILAYVER